MDSWLNFKVLPLSTAERYANVQNCHFRSYVYTGFKLGKSPTQLHSELVQVFGEASTPSLRSVQRWVASIRDDSFTFSKSTATGRPRSVRSLVLVNKVDYLITKDPRLSIRDVASLVKVDKSAVHRIVTKDLEMKLVCSVWVPAALSEKNKQDRIACCRGILHAVSEDKSAVYCVEDDFCSPDCRSTAGRSIMQTEASCIWTFSGFFGDYQKHY